MSARAKTTEPAVKWETYGVTEAERALATNDNNRNLNIDVVRSYARDMLAGEWGATGEAIKFAKSGKMLDGQHRLRAVVEAGESDPDIAVTFLTVYGLDDSTQKLLDTGRRRSQADALQLEGVRNASQVAAAGRLVIRYDEHEMSMAATGRRAAVTNAAMFEWLEQHPEFEPFVGQHISQVRRTELPPGPLMAAYWILSRRDPYKAGAFITELITLEDQGAGSPVLALHRANRSIKATRQRMFGNQWLAMILKAWNKYRAGESAGLIRVRMNEKFPYAVFDDDLLFDDAGDQVEAGDGERVSV